MMVDVAPESFEQQVRDCLAHLYDFSELQTNPLSSQIAPNLSGLQRVETVRRVLVETVEQLRARKTPGIPSRQERVYSLLLMRYVEGLSIAEVVAQLALSERQFYREHHRAIHAVSQLLWARLNAGQPSDSEMSVKSEMQRLSRQSSYATIDIEELLLGVIEANSNLAEDHQVTIHFRPFQDDGDFRAYQVVLRQTVIWMLSQIITHVAAGSDVCLSVGTVDSNPVINFEVSQQGVAPSTLHETLTDNPIIAEFLVSLNATIITTEADPAGILVQLQLQRLRHVILVIDDNPDAVALLERYITALSYEILSATDADEGFRLAQTVEPSCIVLDIMLPHIDGWKMLQNLKSHPRTQSIPVMVCSVLDSPDLALSLGADDYLRKPPNRVDFLEALERWTESKH